VTPSTVRNAVARFNQVRGVTDSERDTAWRRIRVAARKHGVEIEARGWRSLRGAATTGASAPSRPCSDAATSITRRRRVTGSPILRGTVMRATSPRRASSAIGQPQRLGHRHRRRPSATCMRASSSAIAPRAQPDDVPARAQARARSRSTCRSPCRSRSQRRSRTREQLRASPRPVGSAIESEAFASRALGPGSSQIERPPRSATPSLTAAITRRVRRRPTTAPAAASRRPTSRAC